MAYRHLARLVKVNQLVLSRFETRIQGRSWTLSVRTHPGPSFLSSHAQIKRFLMCCVWSRWRHLRPLLRKRKTKMPNHPLCSPFPSTYVWRHAPLIVECGNTTVQSSGLSDGGDIQSGLRSDQASCSISTGTLWYNHKRAWAFCS